MTEVNLQQTHDILDRYPHDSRHLVSVLQDVQLAYRYLPREAMQAVSERLGVPLAKVFGVATFYKTFTLTPRGKTVLRVCTGTACHIRGAPLLLTELQKRLSIKPGETTADKEFTLEAVNCVGACALAPVVLANDTAHGNLTVSRVRRVIAQSKTSSSASKEEDN